MTQAIVLTEQQIAWARRHDWFVGVSSSTGLIVVRDDYTINGRLFCNDIVWTKGFKALRAWAGY